MFSFAGFACRPVGLAPDAGPILTVCFKDMRHAEACLISLEQAAGIRTRVTPHVCGMFLFAGFACRSVGLAPDADPILTVHTKDKGRTYGTPFIFGAGGGNRTRTGSLGSCNSTTKLRLRVYYDNTMPPICQVLKRNPFKKPRRRSRSFFRERRQDETRPEGANAAPKGARGAIRGVQTSFFLFCIRLFITMKTDSDTAATIAAAIRR